MPYNFTNIEGNLTNIKGTIYYNNMPLMKITGLETISEISCSSKNHWIEVDKVYFNNPATVVIWKDGTKTIVKAQNNEPYDKEKGLAMCFMKKAMGNTGNFNDKMNELIDPEFKEKRKKAKKEARKAKKTND